MNDLGVLPQYLSQGWVHPESDAENLLPRHQRRARLLNLLDALLPLCRIFAKKIVLESLKDDLLGCHSPLLCLRQTRCHRWVKEVNANLRDLYFQGLAHVLRNPQHCGWNLKESNITDQIASSINSDQAIAGLKDMQVVVMNARVCRSWTSSLERGTTGPVNSMAAPSAC